MRLQRETKKEKRRTREFFGTLERLPSNIHLEMMNTGAISWSPVIALRMSGIKLVEHMRRIGVNLMKLCRARVFFKIFSSFCFKRIFESEANLFTCDCIYHLAKTQCAACPCG